jgi:hypothetical protein
MTRIRFWFTSFMLLAVAACLAPQARADGFLGVDGDCSMYTWRSASNLYSLGHIPTPPYFALHPPVYYGQRYFRSYGESPYARPARTSRPLIVEVQLIRNPYVAEAALIPAAPKAEIKETKQEDQVATRVQPQLIINPYYDGEQVARK